MKICILTPRFPFPENGGDVLRINNIARYLKSQGHELVLVSFYERKADKVSAGKLYDRIYTVRRSHIASAFYSCAFMLYGKPIQCGYYYSRAFRRLFKDVISKEKPDLYISHLLRMTCYLDYDNVRSKSIIEMTDALSKTYGLSSKAKGLSLKKMIYWVERRLIYRYEKYVIKSFPKVVLVSQSDIDYFKSRLNVNTASLTLHTNGVECLPECREKYDKNKICFIGNMRTLQNQDAVLHFVNDIFPLISMVKPEAKFYIVGAEPPKKIVELAAKNQKIVVTGFVEDLTVAVVDSCLAVAPVQVAAGIQNKVLVAMGMGIPVVMTSLISKAIPELNSKSNCMICDYEQDFANACIALMEDGSLNKSVSQAGYEMVKSKYSWNEKLRGLEL